MNVPPDGWRNGKGRKRQLQWSLRLLRLFYSRHWVTLVDVQQEFGCCVKTARRWLGAAEEAGWPIQRVGDNMGGSPTRYRLLRHY